jgi:hypothetical protein
MKAVMQILVYLNLIKDLVKAYVWVAEHKGNSEEVKDKKDFVIKQISNLLISHGFKFADSPIFKQIVGVLIDVSVEILNAKYGHDWIDTLENISELF